MTNILKETSETILDSMLVQVMDEMYAAQDMDSLARLIVQKNAIEAELRVRAEITNKELSKS